MVNVRDHFSSNLVLLLVARFEQRTEVELGQAAGVCGGRRPRGVGAMGSTCAEASVDEGVSFFYFVFLLIFCVRLWGALVVSALL